MECAVIVGDDDDTGILFLSDFGEKFHDPAAELAVEVRRGLVSEDEAGGIRQGACDGDAFLLAAGNGDREIVDTRADAQVARLSASEAGVVHFE